MLTLTLTIADSEESRTGVMELIMDSNFLNCASACAICLSVIAAIPAGRSSVI